MTVVFLSKMTDVIRNCIREVEAVIDYWIKEGDISHTEIVFVLAEVDGIFAEAEDEEEKEYD